MPQIGEPDAMPEPERALTLLYEALRPGNEIEVKRRFCDYVEFLQPLLYRSALVAYRMNGDLAEDALADLLADHTIQLLTRALNAEAFAAQLERVHPVGEDAVLRQALVRWKQAATETVTVAKGLHGNRDQADSEPLKAQADASNAAIKSACEAGARLLQRFVCAHGVTLRCWDALAPTGHVAQDDIEPSDSDEAPTNALFTPLDRMFARLKKAALTDDELREALAERLTATKSGAAPDTLVELVMHLGSALHQLSRIRLPMLGLLYRMLKTRAIDHWRTESRVESLDAQDDGPGDDGGETHRFGSLATQAADGELTFQYFDNGDAAALLEAIERELRDPEIQALTKAAEEKRPELRRQLAERAANAKARGDFDVAVAQLRLEGCTQEEIAEILGVSRDRVRTALARFEAVIVKLFGEPEGRPAARTKSPQKACKPGSAGNAGPPRPSDGHPPHPGLDGENPTGAQA